MRGNPRTAEHAPYYTFTTCGFVGRKRVVVGRFRFSPHFRSLGVSVAAFNTKNPIPSRKSANKGHQSDRYERGKQICLADIAAEQYAGNGVGMSTSETMP